MPPCTKFESEPLFHADPHILPLKGVNRRRVPTLIGAPTGYVAWKVWGQRLAPIHNLVGDNGLPGQKAERRCPILAACEIAGIKPAGYRAVPMRLQVRLGQ